MKFFSSEILTNLLFVDQRADILLLHLILFMLLCHLQNQKLHEGHQYDSTGINVLLPVKK